MRSKYQIRILVLVAFLASLILISPIYDQSFHTALRPTAYAETSAETADPDSHILSDIFGTGEQNDVQVGNWAKRAGTLTFRLVLAALLAAVLAFRPHKSLPILHRNPSVAQTQILLAVVAAALMMVVANNAARAFGIFAAASLVRFRTNIQDPKEITVLLANLSIGLASGVGRWDLAIIFSMFVLLLLRILEHYEPAQVFRTMELKVRTHHVEATDRALRDVFKMNNLDVEVRELNRGNQEHPLGKAIYQVDLSLAFSTVRLGEEIFSSDPENIDSIEWHQKKTSSYIYR